MSGNDGIENRTEELIETTTEEVVLVIVDESLLNCNRPSVTGRPLDDLCEFDRAEDQRGTGDLR